MKQKIFWLGVFLMGVFLSGCGQKPLVSETDTLTKKEIPPAQQEEKKEGIFSGTIKDLLSKGESQVCSWSFEDEKMGTSSGKVYVSGEKFYQEFQMKGGADGDLQSYVINDGEWIYQWTSLAQTGTKIKVEEAEKELPTPNKNEAASSSENEAAEIVDWDQQMDYNCQFWLADEAKFKVPENIQFTDLNQMINSIQDNAQQMLTNTCKMCENLPAGAKEGCLKGCSQ